IALAAALDGILLALFAARVGEILATAGGDGKNGLLDIPQHLLVDGVAEGLQTAGHGLGVGVLRLQVLLDLWVRFFAQPKVGIDYGRPMPPLAVIDAGSGGGGWGLGTQRGSRKGAG